MKSFLRTIDSKQMNLAEKKQAYESIDADYRRLLEVLKQATSSSQSQNVDLQT
jgi:hypothetical protein